jgi:molybdopterin-guanine dinucleotide biosynthesis protein A
MTTLKPTIALLFTGGNADEFTTGDQSIRKALLPVYGQPIANHVIRALEQSHVEKIFILLDEDADIQESLAWNSKCIFFKKTRYRKSYSLGFLFGLEKMAEYYGAQIDQKLIMFVPCDIPLVTKDNFNVLIEKASGNNADVTITIIAEEVLKKRFPQIRFRSAYLTDLKDRYTLQMVGFMNGALIQYDPSSEPEKAQISFRGVDDEGVLRVKDTIDTLRSHRSYNYHLPRFTQAVSMRWFLRKGYINYVFKFVYNFAINRLTMAKIIAYLNEACRVNVAYIVSEETEFSADIDRPEDFPIVLGIPWDHETGCTDTTQPG